MIGKLIQPWLACVLDPCSPCWERVACAFARVQLYVCVRVCVSHRVCRTRTCCQVYSCDRPCGRGQGPIGLYLLFADCTCALCVCGGCSRVSGCGCACSGCCPVSPVCVGSTGTGSCHPTQRAHTHPTHTQTHTHTHTHRHTYAHIASSLYSVSTCFRHSDQRTRCGKELRHSNLSADDKARRHAGHACSTGRQGRTCLRS